MNLRSILLSISIICEKLQAPPLEKYIGPLLETMVEGRQLMKSSVFVLAVWLLVHHMNRVVGVHTVYVGNRTETASGTNAVVAR